MPVIPVSLGFVQAFLVRGERTVLVDTGMPGSVERILRAAAAQGLRPRDISLIVLTHGHNDHCGSVRGLRERTGAPLAIHRLDAPALRQGASPLGQPIGFLPRLLAPLMRSAAMRLPALEPDVIIEEELDLAPYGVTGRIIPTPGHTPGSVSLFLTGDEAIVGDLVQGSYISRRRPSMPMLISDLDQWRQSMDFVLSQQCHTWWVSHGGPLTPEDVQRRLLKAQCRVGLT